MFHQRLLCSGFGLRIILGTVVLISLGAFDAGATLWGLSHGLITEANPLMGYLIIASPLLFIIVKLLLSVLLGGLFWLIRERNPKLVQLGLSITLAVYLSIGLLHLYWLVSGASAA